MPEHGFAAIVFDCDGVLLDSNELKTACFREVLEAGGYEAGDIARFVEFQRASFGMSRYRLFEALLGWELAVRPPLDRDHLLARYAEALGGRYVACTATPGMREVVGALAARTPVYIVSGSDQAELRGVMAERGDASMFRLILGSPTNKFDNLMLVLEDLAKDGPVDPADLVFVGDAEADMTAARKAGLGFVYMDGFSAAQPRMRALATENGIPLIDDLRELETALAQLQQAHGQNRMTQTA
ncbi:MAG: family hydrolase [Rubritepida sp.]|nr:family hydrolase [Rubritepida sp.]